jgi:crotonobetainyl-CoA:carnitine CoA-transferase CaiB-like acyl-CoA transferase
MTDLPASAGRASGIVREEERLEELPLTGLRVIDLGIVLAGPYGAMMLGDLGADVVRVESIQHFSPQTRGHQARPTREAIRAMPPIGGGYPNREPGERPWNRFPWFNASNRNKRSVTMDLTHPDFLDMFMQLVRISDVVVNNQSPHMASRLGVDYERLSLVNPGIVYVSASLFGKGGPLSPYKGGGLQMEAFVGHDDLRHYPDSDVTSNAWMVPSDAAGAMSIALGALLGLFERRATGRGQYIDVSLIENEIALLGPLLLEAALTGSPPPPRGNRSRCAIQGCYPCAGDDRWLTLTVPDAAGWSGLARLIGRSDWADDSHYEDALAPDRHDEIDAAIIAWSSGRDRDEAVSEMIAAGVLAGPVLPDNEIVDDRHLVARRHFMSLDHVDAGRHRYPGPPYRLLASKPFPERPPVLLGEHNDDIYGELLGLSPEAIEALHKEGQIGDAYLASIP